MQGKMAALPVLKAGKSIPGDEYNNLKVDHNIALGYLRASLVVMVIVFHSVLAYTPFVPAPSASFLTEPRMWTAFPVVDSQRWGGFTPILGFTDSFAMALMFFLSGLFVWKSLLRKGSGIFLRDRFLRLGLPFVLIALLAAPLAYYPSYLMTGASPGLLAFGRQWLSLGKWPAGPVWFIWLLLAFNCIAVLIFVLTQKRNQPSVRITPGIIHHPAALFGIIFAASAAAYIPLMLIFGPYDWTVFGFFSFQTSRLFHYAVYFLAGTLLGAFGIEQGLLAPNGRLARRWPFWLGAAIASFSVYGILVILAGMSSNLLYAEKVITGFSLVLSCAASGFAFLALFARFARTRNRVFDNLKDNVYGMFLVHYVYVSWLQYALLSVPLFAIVKGSIVFFCALTLSWGTTAALRRIPAVARVI